MKRKDYRRAVSQIRWSDEKRRSIEAKLRALPQTKVISDDDDDDEEGYVEVFRMDRRELRARQKEIEREKRRSKIIGRIRLIAVAAGFVAAVGLFGAFVSNTKKLKQQNVKFGEMGSSYGLNLTDEEDLPHPTWSFAEGPDGWYDFSIRYDTVMRTMPDGQQQSSVRAVSVLYRTDRDTGERIPVCSKENCAHDGNSACTASSAVYSVFCRGGSTDSGTQEQMYFTYGAGSLYTVATKWSDPDAAHEANEYGDPALGEQVLLRCETDGSELTEVFSFGTGYGEFKPICHRGYLFFPVQLVNEGDVTEDAAAHKQHKFRSGGYEIWGFELATGSLVKLYSAMANPELDHVNLAPQYLAGIGDYLYFNCDDWNIGAVTRRINLLTGEIGNGMEISLSAGWSAQYGLTGSSSTGQSGWYRVDLITGEQKTLSRFSGSAVPHLTDGYIIGEYISAYRDAAKGLSAGSLKKLELCDTDGQRIREITLPDIPKHEKNSSAEMHLADISDGKVYIRLTVSGGDDSSNTDVICYQTIDELSLGTGEWKTVIDKTVK